jgi:hypothetical protein
MGCAVFRGGAYFWWEDPLVRPGQDGAVGRGGGCIVVLAGDVEGEVDEELCVGFGKGGEAGGNLVLAFL